MQEGESFFCDSGMRFADRKEKHSYSSARQLPVPAALQRLQTYSVMDEKSIAHPIPNVKPFMDKNTIFCID